ncbi:unnamed protein product [Rotaria socialis]|uniref:Major facilitator superfamily (MFS) profile domain-containing protein n=1 Tax=Rotaria socialis TaxID=392032 RepID=A0A817UM56_9BILA|nr:unnamed protein product [Rotaria socialis]CAF3333209.1 unnamed protein product [Rotaria socialis]CAF4539792.1 unnamed protein product [Rotaria socialis]CAF4852208.1 unnamed protein product [Rotaria socialis]
MNISTNQVVESDVADKCSNSENTIVINIESCHPTTLYSDTQNEVPIMASISDNVRSQDAVTLKRGEIEDLKDTNTTRQRVVESSATLHDLNTLAKIGIPRHDESVHIEQQQQNPTDVQLPSFWSLNGLHARWTDPLFRKMLWNVFLLSCSWSLGQAINYIQVSTTTVAAKSFTDSNLATIPIGVMLLIGTVSSIFLPRAIARFGYRRPFYFGALMGSIGAGLSIVAAWYKLYWLLIVSSGFLGGQLPCTLYYRLVALQFSTQEFAPKAIAMVIAGGCFSTILGPEIATHTVNMLSKPYCGAYIATLGEFLLLLFLMTIIQFPDMSTKYAALIPSSSSTTRNSNSGLDGRSIFVIAGQRTFLVAIFIGFVSWSSMSVQMSATPLAMTGFGYSFRQVITAIECHLLGMFVPSFFSGTLCNWCGSRLLMVAGLVTQLIGALLLQRNMAISSFNVGLIFVGIGWNFGYVASSALLMKSHKPEEKPKVHSIYEAITMLSITISFFAAAFAEQSLGWKILTGRLMAYYLVTAIVILTIDTTFVFYKTRSIKLEINET